MGDTCACTQDMTREVCPRKGKAMDNVIYPWSLGLAAPWTQKTSLKPMCLCAAQTTTAFDFLSVRVADQDVLLAKFRDDVEHSFNRTVKSLQELCSGVQMFYLDLRQGIQQQLQLSQELLEMTQELLQDQQQQRQSMDRIAQMAMLSLADDFKLSDTPDLSAVSLGTEHPEALVADCT